uniref:NACHT domain-containing protein n=1 Tax=Daphnia galeata TaxID=27404 RepID=A0A8J2RLH5_9CRUS|nr:unnamed protein product [Daphnia galeata]
MSKRTTSIGGHDGPSGFANRKPRITKTKISSASDGLKNTQQLKPHTNDEMPPISNKGSDAGHGNRFQSKLLMLFCIRAINEGYEFYLGTELAEQGKKFDDLIFKYNKDKNADKTGDNWSYKYLQAKSRLKENVDKITAKDLLSTKKDSDFSLPKYFRSYVEITRRGDNIDSCIICTNIDFVSQKDLWDNGIKVKEVQQNDPILKFEKQSGGKTPKHYKIEIIKKDLLDILKEESDSKRLAQMLLDWINKKIKLNSKSELMRSYHMALVKEKVIDLTTKQFHVDFIEESDGLSEGAKELRQHFMEFNTNSWKKTTFSLDANFGKEPTQPQMFNPSPIRLLPVAKTEIAGFLDKLIFAVNTPNEGELDNVLKNEVGKYFTLLNTDLQSAYIMNEMINWFKSKKNLWLSSEEAKKLFLNKTKKLMESLRVTAISIDYQKQLKEALEFNDEAIGKMKEKLEKLLTSPNKIGRIATTLTKRTALKVIGALEKCKSEEPKTNTNNQIPMIYFQCEDSYLMTSSSRLKNGPFKFESNNSYNLLVVVCEDSLSTEETDKFCQQLMVNEMPNKRVIIISQDKGEVKDELNFSDLSKNSQRVLLEKKIKFQGSPQSVRNLIERRDTTLDGLVKNGDAEKILDFNSIEELIEAKKIEIPSGSSTRFEQNIYIERQLEFPLANFNQFYDQLAKKLKCEKEKLRKECVVDSQGNIKWSVEGERKKKIWEEMKKIVKENSIKSLSSNDKPKKDLITKENGKGKVFIINGIAGTGKSTILSNYYEKIKQENPDTWVIRIDLLDYSKELRFSPVNQQSAIEFFMDIFAKNSPFARTLMTHRFQTDGRIVVMLDGFDEIGDELREKMLQLITAIKLTKVDALYLTTRSHLKEELQEKLFQFSYTLKKFSDEDQIDCLSKYWTSKLKMRDKDQEKSIKLFGKTLVTRLSTTLKDKEKDFIGIPLQCRMLAQIYETQLIDTIQKRLSIDRLIETISTTDLDLTSLYSLFMEKKFEIYVSQKLKTDISNDQLNSTIEHTKNILEKYLIKLAIKTIVLYSDDEYVMWPKSKSFVSRKEMSQKEKHLTDAGVGCGFLGKDDKGEMKFLHRTYAEYLFAKYLHDGFLPEEDENYRKLLTSQPVRETIFRTILIDEQFEGVRTFFNSMIKEKVKPTANLSREIKKFDKIVGVAIRDQNANLFTFLCDCLDDDTSLKKVDVQNILHRNAFYDEEEEDYEFETESLMGCMYMQNSRIFERFISYYDEENADKEAVEFILDKMININLEMVSESAPNQEEMTKIIERIIWFFDRNRETTKKFLNNKLSKFIYSFFIVNALLFKECYSSHLKPFLELLSSVYCEDTEFENFLLKIIKEYKHDISRRNLEKTLTILRDLERNEVLKGISRQIFRMDAQLFKRFYQPKKEADEDALQSTNIESLLERDSYQMTQLHRAALHGNEETVKRILEMVSICSSSPETQKMGMKVLDKVFVNEEENKNIPWITPLYVAAACEHENIYKQMLEFLRDVWPKDKLTYYLTKVKGFLSYALWDAMNEEQVEMFRIILKSVKEILGQDYFIVLVNKLCDWFEDGKILFEVIVEVIVDGENGYKDLNDLLFKNMKIKQFQHINSDTLQYMFSAVNGMDAWMKRLLDTDLSEGFKLMLNHLLEKLNAEQRPQLLRVIISVDSDQESYFDRWVDELFFCCSEWTSFSYLKHFMKCVSDNLGQSDIKELLTRNDNRIIRKAISTGGEELVNKMLSFLSNEEDVISIKQDVVNLVSQFIEDAVNDKLKDKIDEWGRFKKGMQNIIDFVFDNVKKFDLSKLVETISHNYTDRDGDNIWSVYVKKTFHSDKTIMLRRIDNFLKCILDKLGPSAVETLVVEHENGDFINNVLLNINENVVPVLLRHLSQEKRVEIVQKSVENAPTIMTNLKEIKEALIYFYGIIQFVEDVGTNELSKLIESITSNTKTNSYRYPYAKTCVWSFSFLSPTISWELKCDGIYSNEFQSRVDKFLECVSVKEGLGPRAVEKLAVEHENGDFITRVLANTKNENVVNDLLRHLSEEKRDEMEQKLVKDAPEKIKLTTNTKRECKKYWKNILQYVVKHAGEDELLQLIETITQSYDDIRSNEDKSRTTISICIWESYLLEDDEDDEDYEDYEYDKDFRSQNVDKFLQRVSEKLGKSKVKELVMHKCDDGMAILHYVKYYRKDTSLVETMLAHLTKKDREEVWCKPAVEISEEESEKKNNR